MLKKSFFKSRIYFPYVILDESANVLSLCICSLRNLSDTNSYYPTRLQIMRGRVSTNNLRYGEVLKLMSDKKLHIVKG